MTTCRGGWIHYLDIVIDQEKIVLPLMLDKCLPLLPTVHSLVVEPERRGSGSGCVMYRRDDLGFLGGSRTTAIELGLMVCPLLD